MAEWTTPKGIVRQLQRRWDRGELLAARLTGEALFPLEIRLTRPKPREVTDRFGAVLDWVAALRDGDRDARGHGYSLRWEEARNRVHGSNPLPVAAILPTEEDALRLLGRLEDARRFDAVTAATRQRAPELLPWLVRRPLTALEHAEAWERILAVVEWFRAHPRPGIYLRQLDIPGVDTKFIEARRRLLGELLDLALPSGAVDHHHTGVRGFEARYGLHRRPALLRLRLLDRRLYLHGLSDITAPVDELAQLDLTMWEPPLERVFITENEVNGLAFPEVEQAAVIFGLGYALEHLGRLPWLQRAEIHYWGDIDTHGFAILDRLRAHLPHADSLLMDRGTLEAHRTMWGEEPADRRFTGELTRLTPDESSLFQALCNDEYAKRLRLEQERIGFGWVRDEINVQKGP